MKSRQERLLSHAKLDGIGLEIGPLDKALVEKVPGRQICYADYAPREVLQQRSASDASVKTERIPVIDYVVPDLDSYAEIKERFDYIVASHVIEHTPDVAGWLKTLMGLLKPDGRLILAVPDKRYMFDYFRSESTVGDVMEAYFERRRVPSFRKVFDGHSGARQVDTVASWSSAPAADTAICIPEHIAFALAKASVEKGAYSDCHCWVWTFDSFQRMLEALNRYDILRARVLHKEEPVPNSNEFHMVLGLESATAQRQQLG